ncbi:phage protein [Spirochaetia bacterium]|nr:phage protein [Spirochaetia bacterium]
MAENVGDAPVYYHIQMLEKGIFQHTDTTNAYRMLKEHGKDIRYNAAWKKWIVWNGKQWQLDTGFLIHHKGLQMIRGIYQEQLKTADYRDRLDIQKHAVQSESVKRRKAFIEAATWIPELNINSDDLDRDPWLLNVDNGTVNVRTGELKPHCQEDLITKVAKVAYDKNADCPTWKKFIREIMNYKPELITYLQTAAGYGITGDISEQVMFILFGSGANGKSTFLNTIMNLLGDYAIAAPTETFMAKRTEQIGNDLARLRGTRFVTTAEAEQGKKLSETLIKQITGNDKLTARFLYSEYFNFLSTFKIFMATNHKPVIKGTDLGIWRRIILIPFTATFTKEKQDKRLEEKLRAEGPGILNWLLEGTRHWCDGGLMTPEAILNATDEYQGEMDIIGEFIKDMCQQGPGMEIKARELFRTYQEWCTDSNEYAVSERILGLRLKEMGFEQRRLGDGRYWQNIMLKTELGL